jgi:hypothetical protein
VQSLKESPSQMTGLGIRANGRTPPTTIAGVTGVHQRVR